MRSQLRAHACAHSPAPPFRWNQPLGHPKMRCGDRSDGRLCGKLRPHAGSGKHQSGKTAKRKNDTLSKQTKLLSALSGEPIESSGPGGDSSQGPEDAADVTIVKRASKAGKAKKKPSPLVGSIYDHPVIYDWAFGFRDYEAEVRLRRCMWCTRHRWRWPLWVCGPPCAPLLVQIDINISHSGC